MPRDEACSAFKVIRFAESAGEPFCPHCGTVETYEMTIASNGKGGPVSGPMFKCRACRRKFSVTSSTIINTRKMKIEASSSHESDAYFFNRRLKMVATPMEQPT